MKEIKEITERKKCIIKKKLEKREELLAEITRLEEEVKNNEAYIKKAMEEADITEEYFGDYKVGWKEVISERFDSTAFKKANNALYEAFRVPKLSKRFTVYKNINT